MVFDRAGTAIQLTFLWKEVPFIGIVVLAVLQGIGPQYEEIAQTLGANRWQRFRYVLLPLIMPGVLSTSIIVFAFVFANYEIPLLLGGAASDNPSCIGLPQLPGPRFSAAPAGNGDQRDSGSHCRGVAHTLQTPCASCSGQLRSAL